MIKAVKRKLAYSRQVWSFERKIRSMKSKVCSLCTSEETTLYRVQITKGKVWIFVCTDCCNKVKVQPDYRYGGTWKGNRH